MNRTVEQRLQGLIDSYPSLKEDFLGVNTLMQQHSAVVQLYIDPNILQNPKHQLREDINKVKFAGEPVIEYVGKDLSKIFEILLEIFVKFEESIKDIKSKQKRRQIVESPQIQKAREKTKNALKEIVKLLKANKSLGGTFQPYLEILRENGIVTNPDSPA